MRIRNLKYYLKESIKSILKNRLMSLASVITVASCIFILVFSYCIVSNVDCILEGIENNIGNISIYIKDNAVEKDIKELENYIKNIKYVDEVIYISAEEALEEFAKSLGDSKDIIEGLEDKSILPRTLDVKISNLSNQDYVIKTLKKCKFKIIEQIKYDEDIIKNLIIINNTIRIISLVVILFLALISTIIIVNTIKLTVNNRKNEINIMKYVGATDWFIKWPFVIEGILIGIVGSFIPLAISFISYNKTINLINKNIPFILSWAKFRTTNEIFCFLIPLSLILGTTIGAVGSITSIRKHLHV